MIRRAFFAMVGLSCAMLVGNVGLQFGPVVEEKFWPVLDTPIIPHETLVRSADRLCWGRYGWKFRSAELTNFDVFLDRVNPKNGQFDDRHRSFPEAFNEATGEPVNTDSLLPAGEIKMRRQCILLPANVTVFQPLRVTLTSHFHGLLGLWDLPEQFPPIISLGATNRAAPL